MHVGHDVGSAGVAVHRAGMAGDDSFVVVLGTGVASVALVASYRQASGEQVEGVAEVLARCDSDPVAAEVWLEAVSALADALLTACALLAPESIVIAGGVAEAGARLTEPLVTEMRSRV